MSHDQIAKTFDRWVEEGRAARLQEHHGDVVAQVLRGLEIRPGMQTLELGCGTGWATRLLAAKAPGAGAVGVDVSPAMIRAAEANHDLTSRARFEVSAFESLDFPDGRFDRVFSMEALYYAVDLGKALSEAFRVLKPSGQIHVLVDRYKESPHTEAWAREVGVHMYWLSEDEWRTALEGAGFANVRSSRVIDSRLPAAPEPGDPHAADHAARLEQHAAGTLYLVGVKS